MYRIGDRNDGVFSPLFHTRDEAERALEILIETLLELEINLLCKESPEYCRNLDRSELNRIAKDRLRDIHFIQPVDISQIGEP